MIYIWEYLPKITDRWHDGGGVVVRAATIERALELVQAVSGDAIWPNEDEPIIWDGDGPEAVLLFPDAGCC